MGQVKKYVNAEAWGAESTIYCTLDEHANPYTTDANVEAWRAESTIYYTLAEHANPYTTDAVQTRLNKSYKYHHQFA